MNGCYALQLEVSAATNSERNLEEEEEKGEAPRLRKPSYCKRPSFGRFL